MQKNITIRVGLVALVSLAVLAILAKLILPPGVFSPSFWMFLVVSALFAAMTELLLSSSGKGSNQDMLDDLLRSMAQGDLAMETDDRSRRIIAEFPDFQRVLRAFQNVIGFLRDTGEGVSRASSLISKKAKALFTEAEEQVISVKQVRGSIAQLEGDIEHVVSGVDTLSGFTEKTSSAILQMRASIEEVVSATHNLNAFVDEISASIEEMTHSVQEVAGHGESLASAAVENSSAMVEMDATITHIEENIRDTEGISKKVAEVARTGAQAVGKTVGALDSIHSAMETNLEAMTSLSSRSQDIGKILKVIQEIADQTNLLALNAAIIASQAGEHGRSFGVVAEEIRDLSERTATSTSEVNSIITTIQKEVDEALAVAKEGMDKVGEGLKLGKESEENLSRIGQAIETASTSISQIARAASEQARGSGQVTQAIEEMTKRIERISNATREQAQTAQHINEKAMVMKDLTAGVDKAMEEEAQGSNTISEGMEQVRSSVDAIQTSLLSMSKAGQKILNAMDTIGGVTQENLRGARDLSGTSSALRQEALMLVEELSTFKLPTASRGGEVRLGAVAYDYEFDPALSINVRDGELVYNYSEGLVRLGYGTQVLPGLASSWRVGSEGKVYTFTLDSAAKFHNGRPVTSEDVLFSWHRALSPRLEGEATGLFSWVEGVEEFIAGQAETVRGFSAPDDRTVEVALKEPLPFLLFLLSQAQANVLPREAVDETTLRLLKPIGCGPFQISEVTPDRIVLERFPAYHDPEIPFLDRLVFDVGYRSEDELLGALKRGDVHYATSLSNESLEVLLEDPFWENNTETTVQLSTMFVAIRNDLSPYDSKEIRQAMNYAVDRDVFASQYVHSRATPAKGILPPGILGYQPDLAGFHYDPDRAKWLLKKAGYPDGLDLRVAVDKSRVRQAREFELLVSMLKKVGIRVESEVMDHDLFMSREKTTGRPGLYDTGWYADYPDPDNFFYSIFYSKGGDLVDIKYKNDELDALVERGRQTMDVEERVEIYHQAEAIIVEDAPCILLYHSRGVVPHHPSLMGMKLSLTTPTVRPERMWLSSGR